MKTGALIFAFDDTIEYTKIASECARRVKKYLNIPCTLVTNQIKTIANFDNQILTEIPEKPSKRKWADGSKQSVLWHNRDRCSAYALSPYDKTLLLDADFMLNSDQLQTVLDADGDFYAHNTRQYLVEHLPKKETFGMDKNTMWWATVCVFQKTQFTKDLFDAWKMVQDNYKHFDNLYKFNSPIYRNDYALSCALLLCNGGEEHRLAIPWPLLNVADSHRLEIINGIFTIGYNVFENDATKPKHMALYDQDLHIMAKHSLEKLL